MQFWLKDLSVSISKHNNCVRNWNGENNRKCYQVYRVANGLIWMQFDPISKSFEKCQHQMIIKNTDHGGCNNDQSKQNLRNCFQTWVVRFFCLNWLFKWFQTIVINISFRNFMIEDTILSSVLGNIWIDFAQEILVFI